MIKLFTKHPNEQGETYFEHGRVALKCGTKLLVAGTIAIIHGIFPFLFTSTASELANSICHEFDRAK
jgi:hypothetical protein